MSTSFIKDYWEEQAKQFNDSFEASWGDINIIRLEIENIAKHISPDQKVLDVGCANGFAAFTHLDHGLKEITGIDYSPNMIEAAIKRAKTKGYSDRAKFAVGDIQKIDFKDNSFDLVYTTRVVINLPNWDVQKQAIQECLRVTRPGGKVILSEAFWEPLVRLNSLRTTADLSPLQEPDFNRYIKEEKLQAFLDEIGVHYETADFSSIYYLGTRFIRELVTDRKSDLQGFENPFNSEILNVEQKYTAQKFGIQKSYILLSR